MKLLFRQKIFSWFDSYDIYDERGNTVFKVKGQPSWGHKLNISDADGVHIATLKEKIISFLPVFNICIGDELVGTIRKEISFFKPSFSVDYNGWKVRGNFFEFDYEIEDGNGDTVAVIEKQLMNFTDTYIIDVYNDADALYALMVVLAIDAEKCSRAKKGG